jgi:HSP20 family protein
MFVRFTNLQNSLFDDFRRLHQAIDDVFADDVSANAGIRSLPRGSFPAINVVQTPADVQIYAFAPGIDPKDLNVSIQQGLLTIAGKRVVAADEKATYYRQERFSGEFSRAISLGEDVDAERVEATYRDGILQIKLHRRESAKPRQIEIH